MFTPSLVLAYWTCGSAIGPTSHREQALRLFDALQPVLSPVVERHPRRRAGETPHGVRHEHLTRRGRRGYPGGYVYGAAVDVVPLSDDVAGVDTEGQLQP